MMGYMHIDNLYKAQEILAFRECFALEKIHGTSAHVYWKGGAVGCFSGGEKHARFSALFDVPALATAFRTLGHEFVCVYGEAYGGAQQGQSYRYGPALKFVAFDVKIDKVWLSVPDAAQVVVGLGLEFVHYERVPTDLSWLDAQRDAPSVQARRNGMGEHPREGVVLRPPFEVTRNNGERVIAKHKRDDERETKTPRVVDAAELVVLSDANAVAQEWVTPTRLAHVLDRLRVDGAEVGIERTGDVILALVEDVLREGANEIVDSKPVRKAIGARAGALFHARIKSVLTGSTK